MKTPICLNKITQNKNLVVFLRKIFIIYAQGTKGLQMKKILFSIIAVFSIVVNASAYQVLATKDFGKDDAKNQNVIVKCTTDTGKLSDETCSLRRYVKCTGPDKKSNCNSWQPWHDLRAPSAEYSNWKSAASACCKGKGLR